MQVKKLATILVVVAFLLVTGCAGFDISISDEGKAVLTEWVGFDLAALSADKFPELVEPGIEFCDSFLATEGGLEVQDLWIGANKFLAAKFANEPLLLQNLMYASQLVTIQGPALTPEQIEKYKSVVRGFRDGLYYARDK